MVKQYKLQQIYIFVFYSPKNPYRLKYKGDKGPSDRTETEASSLILKDTRVTLEKGNRQEVEPESMFVGDIPGNSGIRVDDKDTIVVDTIYLGS